MRSISYSALMITLALRITGCIDVNTGKITGDIAFQSVTPEVAAYDS